MSSMGAPSRSPKWLIDFLKEWFVDKHVVITRPMPDGGPDDGISGWLLRVDRLGDGAIELVLDNNIRWVLQGDDTITDITEADVTEAEEAPV